MKSKLLIMKNFMALMLVIVISMGAYSQTLVPQKDTKKNLWGYVEPSGNKWVVKPKYESASEFITRANGKSRAIVSLKGKQGFLDENGKILGAGIVFEQIEPLEGDAMFVTVKDKKGVANYDGVYLVKPEAEAVEQLGSEGWFITVKGKKGLLKNDGSFLIQPLYTNIDASVPGYFIVDMKGKAGLLKRNGETVMLPKDYTGIKPYKDNFWAVMKADKTGLIDINTGRVLAKPEYESITGVFLDGKITVAKQKGKYCILDENGKRKERLSGFGELSIEEIPQHGDLFLEADNGNQWIYDSKIGTANRIELNLYDVCGFKKMVGSLVKDRYYTESDKKSLAPFLGESTYFESPQGPTKYVTGTPISSKLFIMSTGDKAYVFRTGEFEPFGCVANMTINEVVKKFGGSKNAGRSKLKRDENELLSQLLDGEILFRLTSGDYVDSDGEKYDIGESYNNVCIIKNSNTGKMCLVEGKPDSDVMVMRSSAAYDNIKPLKLPDFPSYDDYNFVASNDGCVYVLNGNGKTMLTGTDKEPILIEYYDGYKFIIGKNAQMGLKQGDKTLIEPMYDRVEMLFLYHTEDQSKLMSPLFKVFKDGKAGLFDVNKNKMVIPFEKGYTSVGGRMHNYTLWEEFYDAGICFVQIGENKEKEEELARGLWDLKAGKEIVAPAVNNRFGKLPKEYKGYEYNGVAYSPSGAKLTIRPCVEVYQAEWANNAPYFFVKEIGLSGRTVKFFITAYRENGSVYKDRFGNKCIFEFSQTDTPSSMFEYGPKVTAYTGEIVRLSPFSSLTLKYVLTAKDAKTGANIPVKGENAVSAYYEREW